MRFGYRIVAPKKGEPLFTAFIYITPSYYSLDDDGCPLLSPQITESEIDGYIQEYKKDLDRMGKRAKRALQRAHKRTLGMHGDDE